MSGQPLGERAVQLALRCYPRWWRDRYGPDQEALVEDVRAEQDPMDASGAWGLAASFIAGAVQARLTGSGMPADPDLWQRRARTAIVAASVPAALAVGAVVLLLGHGGEYGNSGTGSGSAGRSIQLSPSGQVAYWENIVLALLFLAFIIQLAWAAISLSLDMRSIAPPRRRVLVTAVTLVPAAAIVLGFLLLIAAARLRPVVSGVEGVGNHVTHVWYSYPGHPLAATILFGAGCTGIIGGWFGGTALLATMAARRHFPIQSLAAGVRLARGLTFVQAGLALCALALVITLPLQPPIGPAGGLIWRSDLGPWSPVLCAALAGGALVSWAATRTAGQAVTRATAT